MVFDQYKDSYLKDEIKNIYSDEFKKNLDRYIEFIFSSEFLKFDELLLTKSEVKLKEVIRKIKFYNRNPLNKIKLLISKRSFVEITILTSLLLLIFTLGNAVPNKMDNKFPLQIQVNNKISKEQGNIIKSIVKAKTVEKNIHYSLIYSDLKKFLKKRFNISVKSYKQIPQEHFEASVEFLNSY
jgi:hypothetical protein